MVLVDTLLVLLNTLLSKRKLVLASKIGFDLIPWHILATIWGFFLYSFLLEKRLLPLFLKPDCLTTELVVLSSHRCLIKLVPFAMHQDRFGVLCEGECGFVILGPICER